MALTPTLAPAQAPGAVVITPQVRAELVANAPDGVIGGKSLQLGLLLEHQPQWHSYWMNPGDSGLATTLTWQLSGAATAGDIAWPTPKPLPLGPLLNFGYDGTVLLPVTVTLPPSFSADKLDVKLHAEWLVCKDICIPESGDFALSVPAQAATALHAASFETARRALPQRLAGTQASARVADGELIVRVDGLPADWRGTEVAFFPETSGVILNAAKPKVTWDGASWVARIALDPQRTASPWAMAAVLAVAGREAGVEVDMPITGEWPKVAAPAPLPPVPFAAAAPVAPPPAALGASMTLVLALALAVAGGVLLNLMPCVFPILALKVVGFARYAGKRGMLLAGGIGYTVGVTASFVALAALLLGLRTGGEQIGWGFQLQSPYVVAGLAALFTLIGLNLAGLFEFRSVLPDRLATLQARHPIIDAVLTGMLAVAVAAPCTAPFMGASLGFAVTLPALQALAVFAALGFGMALPYLLASAWPAVARALPRPGRWMTTFRSLMAFPMFGTVVWLVWVLGQQAGIDAVAALLGALVMLAFAAWALAAREHSAGTRTVLSVLAAALLTLSLTWTVPALHAAPPPEMASETDWQPWSADRVAEATANGQSVFVDFTAAWCVTCQFNKRTTLASPDVLADFDAKRVLRLRADWTRRDEAISAELSRLGRNGVPVYALYVPSAVTPMLLSELLSAEEVHGALAALP